MTSLKIFALAFISFLNFAQAQAQPYAHARPLAYRLAHPNVNAHAYAASPADTGHDLAVKLTPGTALVLPGTAANCLDQSNFKTQSIAHAPTGILQNSVGAPRVSFSNFGLTWDSTKKLSIYLVRIWIESPNIKDGLYSYDIYDADVQALIGTDSFTNPLTGGKMNSSDPARDCNPDSGKNVFTGLSCTPDANTFSSTYAACGLDFGKIDLVDAKKSFTAPMTVEVYGYTDYFENDMEPIYANTTAQVQFNPTN